MATPLPTADDVIAIIQTLITDIGPDAFRTNGRIQLYSGPREIIFRALAYYINNSERAYKDAARLLTTPIEQTRVGQFLEKYEDDQNVYHFFRKHYGAMRAEAFRHADKVMRYASSEFIKASYGFAATAVCGAAIDRVFFEVELPAIVNNSRIEDVNGIPAQMIRDFYAVHPYEAFRLICISELLEIRKNAIKSGAPEDMQDYKERRKFFTLERQDTAKYLPAVSAAKKAEIKLQKRQILISYRLGIHISSISSATSSPIPKSKPKRVRRKTHTPTP